MKTTFLVLLAATQLVAAEPKTFGIVNFTSCVTDSKYGKYEQEQLEAILKQYTTLIETTEKELKELATKFEDQDYVEGLSPEAQKEMNTKYQNLSEDLNKYQAQMYQIRQQAHYFFLQRMSAAISKASQKIAENQKLDLIVNKEASFYYKPDFDITAQVLGEMDNNFEIDKKQNALNANKDVKAVEPAKSVKK